MYAQGNSLGDTAQAFFTPGLGTNRKQINVPTYQRLLPTTTVVIGAESSSRLPGGNDDPPSSKRGERGFRLWLFCAVEGGGVVYGPMDKWIDEV